MAGSEPASPANDRGSTIGGRDAVGRAVVRLRGEHDLATRRGLSDTMARVIGTDDSNVVVDLSEVTFMDASTIGALIGARNFLGARARTLTLRSPSRCALWVLNACDLTGLIEAGGTGPGPTGALRSWVPVPTIDREDQPAALRPDPTHGPSPVGVEGLADARRTEPGGGELG